MEAAVGVVADIVGIVHLLRVDKLVADSYLHCERPGFFDLGRWDGRGDARYRHGAGTEDIVRNGGNERGVDAAGEGDDDGTHSADDLSQLGELFSGGRGLG